MKRSKYAKSEFDIAAEEAVSELFADSDDSEQFDFDGLEYTTFGRFAAAVTDLGGVVTIYRKSDSDGVIFSARIGEHRKSFDFISADQFNAIMPQVADQYHLAAHKLRLSRKQPKEEPTPLPSRSSKSKPPAKGSK